MQLDTIDLPDDLEWIDEYAWTPVAQTETYGLTGAPIVQEALMQSGRPITLQGTERYSWVARATVDALYALLTLNRQMTLTLTDGRLFTVAWQHAQRPLEARPIVYFAPPEAGDWYSLTLRLREI